MKYCEINVKSEGQTVREALGLVEIEIDRCKFANIEVLKVIHGYGSHGVGGAIKKELHLRLKELKAKKQISDFIPGEKWTDLNPVKKEVVEHCPELLGDFDLLHLNFGVTIILI